MAGTLLANRRALGANDRVRIGLIGTGGRCMYLAELLKGLPGNEIVAACDVYEPRRLEAVEKMGPQTKPASDYREVLDRSDIDGVVIGAPDHWHVPMTLDAVAAGKDVYCEKPITHARRRRQTHRRVEKSKRVVATGTQQRSWDHYLVAKELIQESGWGRLRWRKCIGIRTTFAPPGKILKRRSIPAGSIGKSFSVRPQTSHLSPSDFDGGGSSGISAVESSPI
jgi:predicted dehydrogenase